MSAEKFYVVPVEQHNALVEAAYQHRGFTVEESQAAAKAAALATWHGNRTHNAIKALHLDDNFGSKKGGCVPAAEIEKLDSRFEASQIWNANKKLGQATAYAAMEEAITLADKYGIAQVSVDNAFHYLYGGGYVMDAAKRGYIAYTNCTAALAEVVPFMGKYPTLGTNPHSWGFPTADTIGFPIVIDWATSVTSMGRVEQYKRENEQLPENAAIDVDGNDTRDPHQAKYLKPFGAHKGYALCLVNELMGAFIGGSLPTLRSRWGSAENEKHTPAFYFQVIHPDALNANDFAQGRSQADNVKAVIDDVLGHGNDNCMLPGQFEANGAARSEKNNGLLFSEAELTEFNQMAQEVGQEPWDLSQLKLAE